MNDRRSGNGHDPLRNRTPLDISPAQIQALGEPKPRIGTPPPGALVRKVDDDHCYEAERVIVTPQGKMAGPGRGQYVDAEELVQLIRLAVREELRDALSNEKGNSPQS